MPAMSDTVAPDRAGPPRASDLFRGGLGPLTTGICLLMALGAFDLIGSATAMPAVLDDLGGITWYGAAIAAPLVASVLSAPWAGRLADRLGVVGPLLGAIALFTVGLLLAIVARDMVTVAVARFVQGLGGGAFTTLQLVVVARCYPLELRGRMLAAISAVWVVPGLVGPALAAAVADGPGWRWVYGAMVPLIAVTAVLVVPALRRAGQAEAPAPSDDSDKVTHGRSPVWWGPTALAGGLVLVLASRSPTLGWVLVAVVGMAIVLVGVHVTMPPGTLHARRGPTAAVTSAALVSVAYLTMEGFLPLVLTQVRDQPLLQASLPLTVASITWTSASILQTRIPPPKRPRWAALGGACVAVGLLGAMALLVDGVPWWVAYPTTALAAFGIGMAFTLDQVVAVEWAPHGSEGTAGASVQSANLLGGALGTSVTGLLLAWFPDDIPRAVAIGLGVSVAAAVLAVLAGSRLPGSRPASAAQATGSAPHP
jgi:MFS family permease